MKRHENESFEDYRKRLKKQQKQIKTHLKGRWYFIASVLEPVMKTNGEGKEIDTGLRERKTMTFKNPKPIKQIKPKQNEDTNGNPSNAVGDIDKRPG